MTIAKRATEADRMDICALDARVTGDSSREEYLTKAIMAHECLVARRKGTCVGFAVMNCTFFEQHFVAQLIVHPQYRRQGVGSVLMRYAEQICTGEKLFTSASESNIAMQQLCDSLGYIRSGTIENLNRNDAELIFVKFLR